MANTIKTMRDNYRNQFVERLSTILTESGEDVLRVKSNGLAFPIVLENGTEDFIKIMVSIPTGTKDEPYDAYSEAEEYEMNLKAKAEKSAKREAEKKAKIERDKRLREKKKAIHEKGEQ